MNTALISEGGFYRWHLTRSWRCPEKGLTMLFVMLNPSKADANVDDPTIKRCITFAKNDGCSDLAVVNVFAWRATDPQILVDMIKYGPDDPVGGENLGHIRRAAKKAHKIVCAWGAKARAINPEQIKLTIAALKGNGPEPRPLWCLGMNGDGSPKHPLYLKEITNFQRYRP